jgi:hypothetical protein
MGAQLQGPHETDKVPSAHRNITVGNQTVDHCSRWILFESSRFRVGCPFMKEKRKDLRNKPCGLQSGLVKAVLKEG